MRRGCTKGCLTPFLPQVPFPSVLYPWRNPTASFYERKGYLTPFLPLKLTDPTGEVTQLAVGGPTWGNPFGHVSIIINGEVFSYGTNYTGGEPGVKDWGASASDFLSAQQDLRETDLMTLNISADQEAQLLALLQSENPYGGPYGWLSHSCVGAIENPLIEAGIISDQPGPVVSTPRGDLQAGRPSAISPSALGDVVINQNLVSNTTVVGTPLIMQFLNALHAYSDEVGQ